MSRILMLLCVLACSSFSARAAEVVVNGNDPSEWKFEVQGSAAATLKAEESGLRIDVTSASNEPFHVQLYQPDKSPGKGRKYVLRFSAKATEPRQIIVLGQFQDDPWSLVTEFTPVDITREWKQYAIELDIRDSRTQGVRLPVIQVGQRTGTVWLRDISVLLAGEKPASSSAPAATVAATEHMKPAGQPANWQLKQNGTGKATLRSEDGALRIDITGRSDNRTDLLLYQPGIDLVAGQKYVLKLIAKASAPRTVGLAVQSDQAPYDALIPDASIDLSTRWQLYTVEFVPEKAVRQHTRMPVLALGGEPASVWVREVSVMGPSTQD